MVSKKRSKKNKNNHPNFRFENNTFYLTGNLYLSQSGTLTHSVLQTVKKNQHEGIIFNLDEIEDIDSGGVMCVVYLKEKLESSGKSARMEGGSPQVLEKFEIFTREKIKSLNPPRKPGFFERIGDSTSEFFGSFVWGYITLAADVFYWSFRDFAGKKIYQKGEFTNQSVLIGANAVLIVVFMSFIIGLVMALQSAAQLSTFGANIYIVDLTVIAMMSQMGPLITAVLVAGRSGSAIAAEIATMKVTSELDALKTMGLDPIRFVVVPKIYASLFTMPFLIILANIAGILGGAVAGYFYLDITPEVFYNRMGNIMNNKDLVTGFVKSQVYAALIVLTGSFYGFRVVRGAEGVGKVTTMAVVVAISLVIIADSVLGLLFY